MEEKVIILMATYNGQAFLKEQIESIRHQTCLNWELYIRDDRSTDETMMILNSFASVDNRIKVLDIDGPHGSPSLNFSVLFNFIVSTKPAYLMFADQDDVWDLNKIAVSLKFIQTLEQNETASFPLLVYSNFQYVDEKMKTIRQELRMPPTLTMPTLLVSNYGYGCTMMLNSALISHIRSIPETAEFHDYWISLAACAFGKAVLLPQKLLKYRQHHKNASTNVHSRTISSRFRRYSNSQIERLPVLIRQHKMISAFFETYQHCMKQDELKLMLGYLQALNKSRSTLLIYVINKKFRKLGLLQTLAHFYTLIYLKNKIIKVIT